MEEFIKFIKGYVDLSEAAENEIRRLAVIKDVPKGTQLLEVGKTCKHMFFTLNGTIRTYFFQNGKDITSWVYPQQYLATSWHSYISQIPSHEFIETTEDTTVLFLTYDEWQILYHKFPELERFGRRVLETQMALLDTFYRGYYFMTAKEKYELLLEKYPDITLRANLGHIASMLGITQETLSRIRGR